MTSFLGYIYERFDNQGINLLDFSHIQEIVQIH